ncbi:uncharacterized protein BT62DRAFT_933158 [Guyanagaster necrorhizus]|uniref:Uncharacterized protein n=1 Tax=Guyanagaster necrorhizus TaxID=856835 RepID=A0A9P7VST7_9AGAR|nr:uncharacterized protein BT62DRAFT_933158 [Guyanagaster necrorhizus MCA 3950]KAG7445316.1 hypothetical protein BT62DRAFT_933158 [Guyanagaster necrorhizus MCA 3950]
MLLLIVSEPVREREENRTISCACSHYFPSSTSGEELRDVESFMDVEEGKRL